MRKLIAFCGRKYVGKDTAGRAYALQGYTVLKFADPLKEMLRTLLRIQGCPETEIERYIEGDLKEAPCEYLNGRTMRHAMQTLGTEWGRDKIDQAIWVDALGRRARHHDKVVVTDCRFPNEVVAIHALGGDVVRITRPSMGKGEDDHPSEKMIDKLDVDREVINDADSEREFYDRMWEDSCSAN